MPDTPAMSPEELWHAALTVDLTTLDSAVLKRLIEEVRQETQDEQRAGDQDPLMGRAPYAYDRVHNRYNRSQPGGPGTNPTYTRVHNRHNRGR